MKGLKGLEELVDDADPDVEIPCPNCDGKLAVWVDEREVTKDEGRTLIRDCNVIGIVHLEGEDEGVYRVR